jgi:MacB-like periplasmic core domain
MKAGPSWKRFRLRLRYWLDRHSRQCLLWEEMEFHIESMTQDFAAQGMPEEEARIAARRRFGNMTRISEDVRFTWIAHWISDLAQDLRYALRGMRRNAGFTTFTILIVGLGIGASSTVFSVVNALLLRPLPFRDPGRLLWMSNGNDATSTQTEHYSDLRALNRSFSDLAAFADWGVGNRQLTGSGEPDRLTSVPVTANFFTLLGVQPALGRWFTPEECQGKFYAPPAMLLSYNFWQRRFASDPGIVGRKLTLDNQPVIVVGVLRNRSTSAVSLPPARKWTSSCPGLYWRTQTSRKETRCGSSAD